MRKTAVDRFSESVQVRTVVVLGWFTISTIAFLSRYDRWTPSLAALMVAAIVGIGAFGLSWAVWPSVAQRRSVRRMRRPGPVIPGPRPATPTAELRGRSAPRPSGGRGR